MPVQADVRLGHTAAVSSARRADFTPQQHFRSLVGTESAGRCAESVGSHTQCYSNSIHGATHARHVSAAPCTLSNAMPAQCRQHTQTTSRSSPSCTCGCCQFCSVQRSRHLLWQAPCAPISLSHTISARTPAAPAAKARTHIYRCCCALAPVSSRKRVLYRLHEQK